MCVLDSGKWESRNTLGCSDYGAEVVAAERIDYAGVKSGEWVRIFLAPPIPHPALSSASFKGSILGSQSCSGCQPLVLSLYSLREG